MTHPVHPADGLTPSQRLAVENTQGPLLVLAGPGSGKTRVITRRIARIVESGVDPANVLAITFTNKAAGEMAERVERLLPGARVWVSTFHRFCARIMRRRAAAVGLKSNFTILDADDQRQVVREVIRDTNFDGVHFPPEQVASRISRAKNDLLSAEEFRRLREERVGDAFDSVVARAYPEYQRRLVESNAVDFDDLLLYVAELLEQNPEIRSELDERFRYILVDEYQDTNAAQYRIVAALSRDYPNLCVTGDPDQSIYGWRGARLENILRFEHDYPQAPVIRLEENFRSTKAILRAADRLIAHNARRKQKTMRTDNPEGPPVELLRFVDGGAEAEGIAQAIREGINAGELRPSDIAIFYRVNSLSRSLEQALARHGIPLQVAGGFRFFERAEIKDVLAYLRLIVNPQDRSAFLRVVNVPPRSIGKKSLERLNTWADSQGLSLIDAAARAAECAELRRAAPALASFATLIGELGDAKAESVEALVNLVVNRTGYARYRLESGAVDAPERLANVNELVTAAAEYDAGAGGNPTAEGFLEAASLVADIDNVDADAERVTLMTLHSAKGLEFRVVYIVGVEDEFLPHKRSMDENDPRECEEERRLLFVGMTRARERLFLTRTDYRALRGRRLSSIPSIFLRETGLMETSVVVPGFELPQIPQARPTPDDDDMNQESPAVFADSDDQSAPERRHHSTPKEPRALRLMTGAELLAEAAARSGDDQHGFSVGMSVRHPVYGLGRIVKISGFARNRRITVEFTDDGRSETFVAGKNPLQPVGAG